MPTWIALDYKPLLNINHMYIKSENFQKMSLKTKKCIWKIYKSQVIMACIQYLFLWSIAQLKTLDHIAQCLFIFQFHGFQRRSNHFKVPLINYFTSLCLCRKVQNWKSMVMIPWPFCPIDFTRWRLEWDHYLQQNGQL